MKKIQDHYFNRAKRDNYPARSVYKLKEMDKKFKLLGPGRKVLDLGAAPGSWSLFAAHKVGDRGLVLAVDLNEPGVSFPEQVSFVQGDIFEDSSEVARRIRENAPYDLVMSDMAPKTTGVKFTDQARSFSLAMQALEVAGSRLRPGGGFVVKILEGPDIRELQDNMRTMFKRVKHFKPKSSRAESKEIFLVGLDLTGPKQS
ncbi:RlmE family RNA methyltransferase [Desulfonatronovibrio hydrogenovorans]|uniref:RlmE family RNA methyltransferase n=1 Tax=Desulfonatronovibrio hydrogenovorans TaxID=53245 RepID=UPI00048CF06D|nr:RlmE family RNA methyltransferase [Desulfonatronovibrio hydrogenovorans]